MSLLMGITVCIPVGLLCDVAAASNSLGNAQIP